MEALELFVIELDKPLDDTITTKSGLELYVDTRFNEFERRITEGPVVSPPIKYNTGVKKGDRSEEHTSELQSRLHLVCRLLLEKKNIKTK